MQLSLAKSADGWCVRCTASESSNEHRVHYRHVEDHTRRRRSLCFSGKWEVIRSSSTQQPLTLLAPSVHRYFSTSPSFAPFLICCAPVVRLRTALLLPSHLWNSTYSECSDWTSVLPCVLQHSGCVTDCHCRHCVPIRYSYRGHQTKLVFSNCFALFSLFLSILSFTYSSLSFASLRCDPIVINNKSYCWKFCGCGHKLQNNPLLSEYLCSDDRFLICSILSTGQWTIRAQTVSWAFGYEVNFDSLLTTRADRRHEFCHRVSEMCTLCSLHFAALLDYASMINGGRAAERMRIDAIAANFITAIVSERERKSLCRSALQKQQQLQCTNNSSL